MHSLLWQIELINLERAPLRGMELWFSLRGRENAQRGDETMSLGVLLVAALALASALALYLNQKIPVSVDLYSLSLLAMLPRGFELGK